MAFYASTVVCAYDFIVDNIYYNILSSTDLTCEVTSNPNKYEDTVVVPEFVDYGNRTYKVVAIGDQAFNERSYKYSHLTHIILPKSIVRIGASAFYCCGGLSTIELPDGLEIIDNNAFAECLNMQTIEIPKSVTNICSWAFHNCYMLKNFKISDGENPIEIARLALKNAGYNLSLYIGRSITNDDESNLAVSPLILEITDGINVGNLLNQSDIFIKIEELIIGSSIKFFPTDLSYYVKLSKLCLHDFTPPPCPIFTDNQYQDIILVVPKGSLDIYKSSEGWKNFINIIEDNTGGIDTIEGAETEYKIFDLTGKAVSYDHKGIVIKKYPDGKVLKVLQK